MGSEPEDAARRREIAELRARIDALDDRLLDLLVERLELARTIQALKRARGMEARDPARERDILERLAAAGAGRYPAGAVRAVFREIIAASLAPDPD